MIKTFEQFIEKRFPHLLTKLNKNASLESS